MGIINMIETIKLIHKEDIVLVKVGTFYTAYGKDAYIINYLFNYKLNKMQDVYSSAFPITSLGKVTAILEKNKINYIVVDKRNNYDVEQQSDNKNLNKYNKFLKIAKEKVNYNIRIERIVEFLQENKQAVEEVEKMIDYIEYLKFTAITNQAPEEIVVKDEDDLRKKLEKGITAAENGEVCSVEEAFDRIY